ncbi:uncharacterized protein I206_107567 [Kwoniella pini CBS 10737]|uniref:Uncharacterized protein n=1 Tax=Kwoniella pini CBS 10737 TaxID=1296096 RepID=A0A1B9HXN1_9TREE|nr:uncharacterized protein I206_05900 [Kwoniella pini CBS 10737]OCF48033.1 hypothetical protein I206_05900 [Kwoniella pini CBS 10737]
MANQAVDPQESKSLEACRKSLAKAKKEQLQDGDVIAQAIDLVLNSYPPSSNVDVKQLELLIVILRQLNSILSSTSTDVEESVMFLVYDRLVPAFQPSSHLSSLITINLEHPQKVQQQRATEALSLAGQLSTILPSPSTSTSTNQNAIFMLPVFRQAIQGGISRRSNLTIIASLLEYIPLSVIPDRLLVSLLGDLGVVDCANIRSTIIVNLLVKQISTQLASRGSSWIIEKLSPYFDPELPHSVMVNVNRYLLPSLFKIDSSYVSLFLDVLSGESTLFGTWVTVASLGVSLKIIKIKELPQKDLKDALCHEDADVRLRAFELVSASKDQIDEDVLGLVKEGFRWNNDLPSAGSRSTFSSSTYAFLVRLHQLETYTRRINRKKPNTESIKSEQESLSHILPMTESFHMWFLQYLDQGLIQARRFPVFKVLLALNLLGRYLEVFQESRDIQIRIFTKDRVEMLFSCQMSEFTEVRNRSRKILESATIPFEGYESLSTPASQALLDSALTSINLSRKTQAEAGKTTLCILFSKLIVDQTKYSQALAFVGSLITKLESAIEIVEKDLVRGIEEYPLHGSLAAIGDLLLCLDLSSSEAQQAWRPTFHHLFTLIDRIWNITKTVISLAPSNVEGMADSDRPDHEIARAYEVMASTGDDDDDGEGDGMDHTGLLSGCWRATRNAGELLATIISSPITRSFNQVIWSKDDINRAGQSFLTWMHEIRHRGTFSKIANAFAVLIEAVRPVPGLRTLCDEWLQHELLTIASDQHSTTRRSAALPYSILSIVSSDEALLDTALTSLLNLAKVDNKATSNVTKVHAFNVLKIVMLDARQTKWFGVWFERGVITALRAFESEDWNVRNVGLILFSTLVHRCLSPARGGQDLYNSRSTLLTRQSFSAFHSRYPQIIPYITRYLEAHQDESGKHSPLFPILIIVRSLRYDQDSEDLVMALRNVVRRYLSSKEFQVRQVAAQALSSMTSPADSLDVALQIQFTEKDDLNTIHGRILYLEQLISNVIIWSNNSDSSQEAFGKLLLELIDRYVPGRCPPITQAVLACVLLYKKHASSGAEELINTTQIRLNRYINSKEENYFAPGDDARQIASVTFLLLNQPNENLFLGLLSNSSTEIEGTLALEHFSRLQLLWTTQTFEVILDIALTGRSGQSIRVQALDALSRTTWPIDVMKNLKGQWASIEEQIGRIVKLRCVPVKEAALVTLGWAIKQSNADQDGSSVGLLREKLDSYSASILSFSHEDQSQPSRYAALKSLTHLTSIFFEIPNSNLHRSLLRLIQDDDEEIRFGASEIISKGLGYNRGSVQAKSIEIYWKWLEDHLKSLVTNQRSQWLNWIKDLSIDEKGYENDLKIYEQEKNSINVLFEIEPCNIFRDPLIDLFYSNKLIRNLNLNYIIESTKMIDLENGKVLSPIDDAWEARRTLLRRKQYQNPGFLI